MKMLQLMIQAMVGPNTTKKPGMMDFVGKAKWEAWSALGSMSSDEAQLAYIQLVDELSRSETADEPAENSGGGEGSGKYETLDVSVENGVYKIKLNRPKKKNAITVQAGGRDLSDRLITHLLP